MAGKPTPLPLPATFRDQRYTARTLVLPGDRTVPVTGALVRVETGDGELLEYLNEHPDFRRQE